MKLAAILLALLPTLASAELQLPMSSDAVTIGRGYDVLRSQLRGDCTELVGNPTAVAGQRVELSLTEISSEQDLASALNVSASAKYGPVSGAGTLIREQRINTYSAWILISLRVKVRSESLTPTRLRETDLRLLRTNYVRFREKCGDSFILTRAIGGEFSALVEIKTRSQQDKTELSAKIQGGQGLFSGTTEGKNKLEQLLKDRSYRVNVVRGGGDGALSINAEELLKAILQFPSQISARPPEKLLTYSVVVQDYLTLDLPPGITAATFSNREKLNFIDEADASVRSIRQHAADIRYVLDNPEQFTGPDIAGLQRALSAHEGQVRSVEREVAACLASGVPCVAFKAPQWTPTTIPARIDGPTRTEMQAKLVRSATALDSILGDIALGDRLSLDCMQPPDMLGGIQGAKCMLAEIRRRCNAQGCRP